MTVEIGSESVNKSGSEVAAEPSVHMDDGKIVDEGGLAMLEITVSRDDDSEDVATLVSISDGAGEYRTLA